MTNPLGLRLAAVEILQREGHGLTAEDRGTLAAARRHGDPEVKARAEAVERIEARRAAAKPTGKPKRRPRTFEDDTMGDDR